MCVSVCFMSFCVFIVFMCLHDYVYVCVYVFFVCVCVYVSFFVAYLSVCLYIYVYIYIYLVLQYYLAARSRDLGKVPGLLSGRVASGAPCAGARRAQRLAKRLL